MTPVNCSSIEEAKNSEYAYDSEERFHGWYTEASQRSQSLRDSIEPQKRKIRKEFEGFRLICYSLKALALCVSPFAVTIIPRTLRVFCGQHFSFRHSKRPPFGGRSYILVQMLVKKRIQ